MSAWITLSVIALLPLLLRTRKMLFTALRVSADDPWRLAGPYWRYKIHTFTGYASDVGQRSDSITTGTVGSDLGTHGQVSRVHGSISTSVVVVDRFFLADGQGETQSFQLSGFNAALADGHLVSVASVARSSRARKVRYFMVHNHTTRRSFFSDRDIRKGITFPFSPLYGALLILMILPIPVVVVFGLADTWQVRRFKRNGVQPLIEALAANAPAPPRATPAADGVASQIQEIVVLRDSGALTEPEFEAAKAKLLGT